MTIWLSLGGIGLICNLIVDIPQATASLAKHGPEWMSNPSFWIGVFIVAATGVAIWLTWRGANSDDPNAGLLQMAKGVSIRCYRLAMLLGGLNHFYSLLVMFPSDRKMNVAGAFQQLEIVHGAQIKEILGEDEHAKFTQLVMEAKTKSQGDPLIVCGAALPHVEHVIWDEMFIEMEKANAERAASQPASFFAKLARRLSLTR